MMPRRLFVSPGQRIGHGVVINPEIRVAGRYAAVLLCDCGSEYRALVSNLLKPGHTTSCGCHRRSVAAALGVNGAARATHGLSDHPLFTTWRKMIDRCENPRHPAYHRYGGRGIKVCDRWHDVRLFVADVAAGIGPRPAGMSMDRVDNDRGYEPGNIRWATPQQQAQNRSPR